MATIIFSALGTIVGGPLGGAIGGMIGRQVDGAILGGGRQQGPRLKELAVTTSSYGAPLPRHFGRMRVAGQVIWATELIEHSETQGGKNRPSVTTYSYTASFAVALASRPIAGIGRIWADGNLLRGESGDLKALGTMRVHTGHGDQEPDPLIAATEGADRCPAWRGLAYVVFEDLELGDFFNRIPSLTFEVIADADGFALQDVVGDILVDADAAVALDGIAGLSCEGPLIDVLQALEPIFPMSVDAGGGALTIARERLQDTPIALGEAAIAVGDGDFGGAAGFVRKRVSAPPQPPEILRYYDMDRGYLPGLQRAAGRARPGQPQTVELPAAMTAADARRLAQQMARRADWARDRIVWRTAELDSAAAPGAIVSVPGRAGRWRVQDWEWRETGVELTLARVVPTADADAGIAADAGRINPPHDFAAAPTVLAAFELPWDGSVGGDAPALFAAVSAPQANWRGASLFSDLGDGALLPLGPSGRARSIIGSAEDALGPANPLLFDRSSTVIVTLLDGAMELPGATGRQLALGTNRAVLGDEIIQFAQATPLGAGRWRLSGLLRGRGGTERAVGGHAAGEPFVLLDGRLVPLDAAIVGTAPAAEVVAAGLGDDEPVASAIGLRGITLRPLAPVHPRTAPLPDGSLALRWTRRARGAWQWSDGIDAPLHEQSERYLVTLGPIAAPAAAWETSVPALVLAPATVAGLAAVLPGGPIHVRQQGSYALSEPLLLANLP